MRIFVFGRSASLL